MVPSASSFEVNRSPTGGVTFRVQATPGSSRSQVRGLHGNLLKVAVQAPPEKGKANEQIVQLLAAWLNVPKKAVRIVAGETARQKRVEVDGVTVEALHAKVAAL